MMSSPNNELKSSTTANVKKGSYPSRQRRFGPAPLASFEDLPSDDQNSPDDDLRDDLSPDPTAIERALEIDSQLLLQRRSDSTNSQRSITPTDTRANDTASQNTLTLGLYSIIFLLDGIHLNTSLCHSNSNIDVNINLLSIHM